MNKRRLCVLTGSRAEYGLLYTLMKRIMQAPCFELQLIVTGMHLSPEFGLTYKVIEQDGFFINEKAEILLSSDTPVGLAKSLGLATIGIAEALERIKPDLLILLGDRYEIIAAAQAALVMKIPVAHLVGGDTTEGSFDEAIRHSITKMAHLHFVTNQDSAKRVRQLGENPDFIFTVGSPGIDQIKSLPLLSRKELAKELDFKFLPKNLLVTFHPVTLDERSSLEQFRELLKALDKLSDKTGIIITHPNADTQGRALMKMIDEFVAHHPTSKAYTCLGQLRYLSTIAQVDAVVGNSSSGFYEAPSFRKPTVNIGDRQKGRLRAGSIIDCAAESDAIYEALQRAFIMDCSKVVNPYGDGDSSARIVEILKGIKDYKPLIKKHFFDLDLG